MRKRIIAFTAERRERILALTWLLEELKYADKKFNENPEWLGADDARVDATDFWFGQISNYVSRVQAYGLADPRGMQAMLKIMTTTLGWAEAAIRTYGKPPKGGYPSGEIHMREGAS